ncbi:hypothetical protein BDV35DRAFT_333913, partial [Aspergillus flavus]
MLSRVVSSVDSPQQISLSLSITLTGMRDGGIGGLFGYILPLILLWRLCSTMYL